MKQVLTLFIITLFSGTLQAQKPKMNFTFELGYKAFIPVNRMTEQIPVNHSAFVNAGVRFVSPRISLLFTGSMGNYSNYVEQQVYTFNNTSTAINTRYTSGFNRYGLMMRWEILKDKELIPFLVASGGVLNFSTRIIFNDNGDGDHCRPLATHNVYRSITWYAEAGAGLFWDIGNRLNKNWKNDRFFLLFSASYMYGGKVKYLKAGDFATDPGEEHNHEEHEGGTGDGYRGDYKVEFLNVPTGEVHEHKVAEVFENQVSMLLIDFGFRFKF